MHRAVITSFPDHGLRIAARLESWIFGLVVCEIEDRPIGGGRSSRCPSDQLLSRACHANVRTALNAIFPTVVAFAPVPRHFLGRPRTRRLRYPAPHNLSSLTSYVVSLSPSIAVTLSYNTLRRQTNHICKRSVRSAPALHDHPHQVGALFNPACEGDGNAEGFDNVLEPPAALCASRRPHVTAPGTPPVLDARYPDEGRHRPRKALRRHQFRAPSIPERSQGLQLPNKDPKTQHARSGFLASSHSGHCFALETCRRSDEAQRDARRDCDIHSLDPLGCRCC